MLPKGFVNMLPKGIWPKGFCGFEMERLSRWAQCNHKGSYKEEEVGREVGRSESK